jgi:hypothetical protein
MRWKLLLWLTPIAAIGVVVGLNQEDDNDNGEKMTPTEAACEMMRGGDSPDEAYRAMVILLDDLKYSVGDTELAARTAVDRAVADGC